MRSFSVIAQLILLTLSFSAFAQPRLSDESRVTLLTCGPGEELYSVFGHTAIRVQDPLNHIDVVYNYGTFDFNTPNFYLKFVKGDLQYLLSNSTFDDFLYTYQHYNRDVFEQELNLTTAQNQQVLNELEAVISSDRRFYTYKFIDRNCTTMAGDIISQYAGVKISMENADKGKTNRRIIYEYLHNKFYESLGINLMFGYKTDKEMDRLFLPRQLMEGLANTKTTTGPLAKPAITLYKSTSEERLSAWNNIYTFTIACILLIVLSRKKLVARTYLAITGLLGIVFLSMAFYSLHSELQLNYNTLLFNPLSLVLLGFTFAGKNKAALITGYVCLAGVLLHMVLLIGKPHFVMFLPLTALTGTILFRAIAALKKPILKKSK